MAKDAGNNSVYRLLPSVQHYDWGVAGPESFVYKLSPRQTDSSLPHAELWFGAHSKASSLVESSEGVFTPLSELLTSEPMLYLGSDVVDRFSGRLPFLFKILSVAKPLSVQLHPNKEMAVMLNAQNPLHYPDSNHKPEMSVALTEVELLFGFRTLSDILGLIGRFVEFSEFVSSAIVEDEGKEKARIFSWLMHLGRSEVSRLCLSIAEVLRSGTVPLQACDNWFLKAFELYPGGDVGLFSFFFLNYFRVPKGEALFIGPNIPHAYLSGEMVECMASSDNVVRLGLTSKYCDVDTMLEVIDYSAQIPKLLVPAEGESGERFYQLPCDDFRLSFIDSVAEQEMQLDSRMGILFSETASGTLRCGTQSLEYSPGTAFFVVDQAGEIRLSRHVGKMFRIELP
ncbi:MAG: mannose-6-phosphate isomerase, class I [bacterium]|nr:mannose-6-phosphate isomerase, class I [bacterium]